MPFPGGVAASGSKAGSRYKFSIASTYDEYCPTLREKLGRAVARCPPASARSWKIIINGHDLERSPRPRTGHRRRPSTRRAWSKISAGNYGGRLGKSFIYLHPEQQPA